MVAAMCSKSSGNSVVSPTPRVYIRMWLVISARTTMPVPGPSHRAATASPAPTPHGSRSPFVMQRLNVLASYQTTLITTSTVAGVWLNLSLTNLTAPAGTAFVRYQTMFRQPLFAGGSVLFDDLNLNQLAGAVPPTINSDFSGWHHAVHESHQQNRLHRKFAWRRHRGPTASRFMKQIDAFIDDRVLMPEAMLLGLKTSTEVMLHAIQWFREESAK